MKRKRIKKYLDGGTTPSTGAFTQGAGWTSSAAGQGLGMFGGMAGSAIAQADQADGHMSTGGALGSGALKGAAMGMALGPAGALIGGAIGAAGGLMQRNKFNEESRRQEEAEREAERRRNAMKEQMKLQQMNAALDAFPVTGNSTPRFSMGGPTDPPGGERYFAMPNYGNSMDPNARPSMDFYVDGQLMPSTDFAKQLPAGVNINDIAMYGYQQAKPTYSPSSGWSYSGQNDYMKDFARMQGGQHALGGTTLGPQYEAEGGEMIQYQQGDKPKVFGKGGISEVSSQEYEIKGPSHKQGGVDMSDDKGARIYSNKLTVDSALMAKLSKL